PRSPRTLFALLLCLLSAPAAAQGLTFAGIPWGLPADLVRARLGADGFASQAFQDHADRRFKGGEHLLVAVMRADRLVGVWRWEEADSARSDTRLRALADSLAAALGPAAYRAAREAMWLRGFTGVQVVPSPAIPGGPPGIAFTWAGLGGVEHGSRDRGA